MTTEQKRALVVRGGWPGHEPVVTTDLFVPFLRDNGYAVEVSDTLGVYEDAALLAGTDLVLQCWTMGEITKEQRAGLVDAVRAGTGFAGWHGGIVDAFRGDIEYTLLTGGQFLMHPPGFSGHAVTLAERRADHPVIAGLGDFRVHTEKYWMATDGDIDVLATVEFAPGERRPYAVTMPAVWTRTVEAGRVFVSTIGHKPDDFDVPEVRTITERGLLWASR